MIINKKKKKPLIIDFYILFVKSSFPFAPSLNSTWTESRVQRVVSEREDGSGKGRRRDCEGSHGQERLQKDHPS